MNENRWEAVARLDGEVVRGAGLAGPAAAALMPMRPFGQAGVGLGGLGILPRATILDREAPRTAADPDCR